MSIVLVVIGLIIGGILVGQDLISAAAVRAQISQIEKYNTAAHAFQSKYSFLPGDLPNPYASQFGFNLSGRSPVPAQGEGDGNGLIEGFGAGANSLFGEALLFWSDLSTANMIDGKFTLPNSGSYGDEAFESGQGANIGLCLPLAKIGNSNYVSVFSGGYQEYDFMHGDGANYFGLVAIPGSGTCDWFGTTAASAGLRVQQAFNIDSKIDDGLPQSGRVLAFYTNPTNGPGMNQVTWAASGTGSGASADGGCCQADPVFNAPITSATPWASTNCYDNNGIAGTQTYSMAKNAALINCSVSFKFQ